MPPGLITCKFPTRLQDITAHLLTEQPEDPISCLQQFLSELQQGKDSSLFSETNFESTFEQLDEAKTGFISLEAAGKVRPRLAPFIQLTNTSTQTLGHAFSSAVERQPRLPALYSLCHTTFDH